LLLLQRTREIRITIERHVRPVDVHRDRRPDREVFPRPAIEADQRRHACNQPRRLRHGERGQNTVRARHRQQFAVRIDRRLRPYVGVDQTRLGQIDGAAHRRHLDKPKPRMGTDEPRIDMLPGHIHYDRACRRIDGTADRRDLAVHQQQVAADVGTAHGVDRRAPEQQRHRLFLGRHDLRSVEASDEQQAEEKDLT